MRKRNFLKAVCLFTCLSILMLSVPGAIASERTGKKFDRPIIKKVAMLFSFLPFLNLNVNDENGDTSSDTVSNEDSSKKIKITGTLILVKVPKAGD